MSWEALLPRKNNHDQHQESEGKYGLVVAGISTQDGGHELCKSQFLYDLSLRNVLTSLFAYTALLFNINKDGNLRYGVADNDRVIRYYNLEEQEVKQSTAFLERVDVLFYLKL